MPVIALVGNKGGAGKTTLCINLASAFAERDKTVVLDADPQQSSQQLARDSRRQQRLSSDFRQ